MYVTPAAGHPRSLFTIHHFPVLYCLFLPHNCYDSQDSCGENFISKPSAAR
jgi:hypothetical protein